MITGSKCHLDYKIKHFEFAIIYLGILNYFICIEMVPTSQCKHVVELLEKEGMYNYKLVQTLFSSSNKLSKSLGSLLADNTLSLQIIDALCHDMHDIEW